MNQVSDWDKLKVLVRCLAVEDSNFQKEVTRKEQIKVFVLIAEVFQYQILEYIPLFVTILIKKLEQEGRITSLRQY